MPGHKPRTNKGLAIAAVLMCLACGVSFTQSSASHSPITDTQTPDMFVAGNTDDSQIQSGGAAAENTDAEEENTPEDVIPTETPAADTPAPDTLSGSDTSFEVSPEASQGVWTPVDSNWYFMVNGEGYKGWLTDTDGHRYYFNDKGVMQTGWLELDGKRYYLNADGVLQTGDVTIDGKIYHFGADGAQQGEPTTADDSSNQDLVFYMNTTSDSSNADNLTASATGASTPAAEADISSDRNEDSRKASSEIDETSEASSAASEVSPVPEASVTSEPTVSPEPKGMIALTFDDGPSDFTDRLLDCLEANNVKATFFLAGQEVEYFQEPVKRMEELGCEIGNHSYDHPDLTTLSADDAASQLSRTDQLIQDLTGHIATVVRPPYGSYNDTVAETAARPLILWSVDTLDWETQNADSTVQNVMDNASDGQIILMHDIFKESVDAAEIFIPQLLQEGYQLVTVSELAAAKGITLENGTAYGSF